MKVRSVFLMQFLTMGPSGRAECDSGHLRPDLSIVESSLVVRVFSDLSWKVVSRDIYQGYNPCTFKVNTKKSYQL